MAKKKVDKNSNKKVKESKEERKLTKKLQLFCEEYVKDYCGAKAATRAGYSVKTARTLASMMLTKLNVKAYIAELEAERAISAEISEVELIKDLKKIKENESNRLSDRVKAIELLGRYKGMDKQIVDNTVKIVIDVIDDDEKNEE